MPTEDAADSERTDAIDASNDDTGRKEAGQEEAGQEEAGREESGQEEAGREESGQEEAGREEAGHEDTVQCWLVHREYTDKGLVTLVYATPDGERAVTMQRSSNMLARTDVTAARDVDAADLQRVDDPDTRERYATEADRTRSNHDPDDAL
jgi:hypothetical protein